MSNSNYSIGLQRLKPVHTAYCGLHNLAENLSWARDVNGRDRYETETSTSRDRDETLVVYVSRPSRDRDVETKTTTLPVRRSSEPVSCKFLNDLLFLFVSGFYREIPESVAEHRGLLIPIDF